MTTEYGEDHLDFRGGKFTGSFTAKKVEYRAHGPAPTALDALPARAVGFTGREGELQALLDALDPSVPDRPEAVLVAAVSGLGGIGKTSLAVEAGYRAGAKGWFPGGTLFVDLHGYDDDPVTADQALQALLRALGIDPEHIPATADERAALYRSTLAQRAQERGPVLVLADNVSSSAQVRPLVPGGGARHRLLVTARGVLSQLGARLLRLEQLSPQEAYELLDRALRIGDPADGRIPDEAEAATELASRCGYLPLALQIAAALLVPDRDKSVAELAAELSGFRDRLVHLDDGERSVRAAFDLSYRRLPADQARLLRLIALAPGREVTIEAVTALAGGGVPPARGMDALARAHLVERGSGRGEWRLHDLVRAFGLGVVAGDAGLRREGEKARKRLLEFYLRWTCAADDRLRWLPGMVEPRRFADREQALAWLDRERAGLVAAVQWAGERRHARRAAELASYLQEYLRWRRYFDDAITVARTEQEAAHRARAWAWDGPREARAWNSLGIALREVGRLEEAIDAHSHARDLYQAVGDRRGEAPAWGNLGIALGEVGRLEEAIDAHSHARALYQATGNRRGDADTWTCLGAALQMMGRLEEAIDAHARACDLYQTIGDRYRSGTAWHNLGEALGDAGRAEEAIKALGKAVVICREFADWYGMGQSLASLAFVHEAIHHPVGACGYYLQAADAYTQANALTEAAEARARAEAFTP